MLLRSSSAPILSSLLSYSKESSAELEPILQLRRTTSVLCLSQNFAETDLQTSSRPKKKHRVPCSSNVLKNHRSTKIKERDEARQKTCMKAKYSIQELFSSSGLDEGVPDHEGCGVGKKDNKLQSSVMDGGMGCNGGWNFGGYGGSGRGSDDGHGRGWDFSEGNNHGSDRMDDYYQNMIEANPNDPLLLGNYAKFLKEVRGDYPKAEEYLERAILANPGDGHILSIYADLIWQTEKNADRAEGYFDQAIKNAPDDCYVMASYAKFLWDAEENEEDKDCRTESDHSHTYPTQLFQGTNHHPHLTAAS